MEAGHILLGRPLKFDRKIIWNGLTNEITLTHLGTKFVLHQVAKDQLTMKDKRDEEQKLEKQKKKIILIYLFMKTFYPLDVVENWEF